MSAFQRQWLLYSSGAAPAPRARLMCAYWRQYVLPWTRLFRAGPLTSPTHSPFSEALWVLAEVPNDSLLLPSLCPKPAAQPTAHQLLCLQRHSWLSLVSSSQSLHADGPLSRGPTSRRAAPLSLASPHPGSATDPLLHFKKQNYVLIK